MQGILTKEKLAQTNDLMGTTTNHTPRSRSEESTSISKHLIDDHLRLVIVQAVGWTSDPCNSISEAVQAIPDEIRAAVVTVDGKPGDAFGWAVRTLVGAELEYRFNGAGIMAHRVHGVQPDLMHREVFLFAETPELAIQVAKAHGPSIWETEDYNGDDFVGQLTIDEDGNDVFILQPDHEEPELAEDVEDPFYGARHL